MGAASEPSHVEQLLARIGGYGERDAVLWRGQRLSYAALAERVAEWGDVLRRQGIGAGDVVAIHADYSPGSVGLLLALLRAGAIAVPLAADVAHETETFSKLAGAERLFRFEPDDRWELETLAAAPAPELIRSFRARAHPGLVVFTSGSTGRPKGILHDCERLLQRFAAPRRAYRTLLFLLFDHLGGFNTFLSVVSQGGAMVIPDGRTPEQVARAVEAGRVELLPVTPTLLKLLVVSGAAAAHDFSSVELVTYGTEVMPEATLEKIARLLPRARLQQTYGLSELGTLRSRSRSSDSVWVEVGGPGFETRVVDGVLHVRSELAMVGYLNAESPFDADGWISTGDRVEQRGAFFRILGRESDLINVGGQKVFPAEVEAVLLEADNVDDATVYGERHPLMGSVVMARVALRVPEAPTALRARLRRHCLARLAPYKVPVRFSIGEGVQHSQRFKKQRPKPQAKSPPA